MPEFQYTEGLPRQARRGRPPAVVAPVLRSCLPDAANTAAAAAAQASESLYVGGGWIPAGWVTAAAAGCYALLKPL